MPKTEAQRAAANARKRRQRERKKLAKQQARKTNSNESQPVGNVSEHPAPAAPSTVEVAAIEESTSEQQAAASDGVEAVVREHQSNSDRFSEMVGPIRIQMMTPSNALSGRLTSSYGFADFDSSGDDDGVVATTSDPYPPERTIYFWNDHHWNIIHEEQLKREGIDSIVFGWDFVIQDLHIKTIAKASPALLQNLKSLTTEADPDHDDAHLIGNGSIRRLLPKLPNLVELKLNNAVRLKSSILSDVFKHCPKIRNIGMTGSSEKLGRIANAPFIELRRNPSLAKDLEHLDLRYQQTNPREAERLSGKRHMEIDVIEDDRWVIYQEGGRTVVDGEFDNWDTEDDMDEMMDHDYSADSVGPNGQFDYHEQFRGFGGYDVDDWPRFATYGGGRF